MAPDAQTINRDPDLEWLDLIRPTGLVLSPTSSGRATQLW